MSQSRKKNFDASQIERAIFLIRDQKVLFDSQLAILYGVDTRSLIQAVRRNIERFPSDFAFQLTLEEVRRLETKPESQQVVTNLRSQIVISSLQDAENINELVKSGLAVSYGGRRTLPYVFTEQGVAMLSSVLRSPQAVVVNIEIMRAFVRLQQLIATNTDLARKVHDFEKKYDRQFELVFEVIRKLTIQEQSKVKSPIGFGRR